MCEQMRARCRQREEDTGALGEFSLNKSILFHWKWKEEGMCTGGAKNIQ